MWLSRYLHFILPHRVKFLRFIIFFIHFLYHVSCYNQSLHLLTSGFLSTLLVLSRTMICFFFFWGFDCVFVIWGFRFRGGRSSKSHHFPLQQYVFRFYSYLVPFCLLVIFFVSLYFIGLTIWGKKKKGQDSILCQ